MNKVWGTAWAATALLIVGTSAAAHAQGGRADVQQLVNSWHSDNSSCRGTPGADPDTFPPCLRRQKVTQQLSSMGYCYGKQGEAGYQMVWHTCGPTSNRVDASPQQNPAPPSTSQSNQQAQSLPGPAAGGMFVLMGGKRELAGTALACVAQIVTAGEAQSTSMNVILWGPVPVTKRFGPYPGARAAIQALEQAGWFNDKKSPYFFASSGC